RAAQKSTGTARAPHAWFRRATRLSPVAGAGVDVNCALTCNIYVDTNLYCQEARRDIMGKMCPVVHFEMPYEQHERMADFYRRALGWQTQMRGAEMGNYVLATTAEMEGCTPKTPGTINGGFYAKKPDWPAQHPSVVIAVEDIEQAMQDVKGAGGEVL